ncbi:unnamed protein product [Paramecium octaurelia]|uniref:Uncharacterized protein n=1 Tax=Paramecium octaurelia TaxID=43137 RepID=A0A8S1XMN2_PAROT|nr:unnamed protein product [Paramecium octaurelia]
MKIGNSDITTTLLIRLKFLKFQPSANQLIHLFKANSNQQIT